ncbi:Uncharacterised protein [Mycobacteroides abscessus]|nr:Uncharacterised protein [Mycobacteroides abscessus]
MAIRAWYLMRWYAGNLRVFSLRSPTFSYLLIALYSFSSERPIAEMLVTIRVSRGE